MLTSCPLYQRGDIQQHIAQLDDSLNPQADSCCFRCYLPTRLCKGPLLTDDGRKCLAPRLLLSFWTACHLVFTKQPSLGKPYFGGDWVPKAWQPDTFQEPLWKLDTEMVGAAWVFYCFTRRYVGMHGYDD